MSEIKTNRGAEWRADLRKQIKAKERTDKPRVQMPELDGMSAAREIRQLQAGRQGPRLPLMALTARILEEDHLACREAGFDVVATKPPVIEELVETMNRLIKEYRA